MVGKEHKRGDRQVDVSVERKFIAFRPRPQIPNHLVSPETLVKVHKMYHKDHPLPELNLDPELNRWATSQEDNTLATALVFDLPVTEDKKPDIAITFSHHFDANN